MRVLLQRVTTGAVAVEGQTVAQIGPGLLALVGVAQEDNEDDIEWLARKIVRLRIFADQEGKMNRSVSEVGGEILMVSQFTLHASTEKGNRPSFTAAAPGDFAQPLFDRLVRRIEALLEKSVATGVFGANMQIALVNDGPVTIWMDSRSRE